MMNKNCILNNYVYCCNIELKKQITEKQIQTVYWACARMLLCSFGFALPLNTASQFRKRDCDRQFVLGQ